MTSERTLSRLSRILALIPYVLADGDASVTDIMERFGYTEDQLIADLNTVFVCGLPGYGPGDLMEAFIDEDEVIIDAAGYFDRAPRLTSTEAISLLAAGLAISGTGQGSEALDSAVAKLTAVVLPDASEMVAVDVSGESEVLTALRGAAQSHKVVEIVYRSLSRETETVREVEPWSVTSAMGNWYLLGYCRLTDDERTFRVDRIKEYTVRAETFEPPKEIPERGIGYSPSDDDVWCDLSLDNSARWVLDYYPVEVLRESKNRTQIRFFSPDTEIPARLLLRLGGRARLLRGDKVRARVATLGASILNRYQ